jgi:non-specific serine/threonine protein kinase
MEQLDASGEALAVSEAHAVYFLGLAERTEKAITSGGPDNWRDLLVPEVANFRAAQTFFAGHGEIESALRLVTALQYLFWIVGDTIEARQSIEAYLAIAEGVAPAVEVRALGLAARLRAAGGDCPGGRAFANQALALARADGNARGEAQALEVLGMIALYVGENDEARRQLEASVALYRALDLRHPLGHALCQLAWVGDFGALDCAGNPDDLARSTAYCEEALTLFRAIDQPFSIAKALFGLGYLAYRRGDIRRATAALGEAIALRWELHDLWELVEPLEDLADVAALTGRPAQAARLYGAVEALRERIGKPIPPFYRAEYERELTISRTALGDAAFAAGRSAGRALPLDQAIAEALALASETQIGSEQNDEAAPAAAGAARGLTPREQDVLRLLVEGRSNPEIAAELAISPKTVSIHVTNILAKLGADSRTAAASFAIRHRLV